MGASKISQYWDQLSIQKKMVLYILLISIIPLSTLLIERSYSLESVIYTEKKLSLNYQADLALSQIDGYYQDFQSGKYESSLDAKLAAMSMVNKLRYGEDNLNYFWIQARYENNTPYMVLHRHLKIIKI